MKHINTIHGRNSALADVTYSCHCVIKRLDKTLSDFLTSPSHLKFVIIVLVLHENERQDLIERHRTAEYITSIGCSPVDATSNTHSTCFVLPLLLTSDNGMTDGCLATCGVINKQVTVALTQMSPR
jgi:hypothetical protein